MNQFFARTREFIAESTSLDAGLNSPCSAMNSFLCEGNCFCFEVIELPVEVISDGRRSGSRV
ncbi:MAG TPA: hypothetical protein VF453_10950 [Burkholderiaceae bacterium]